MEKTEYERYRNVNLSFRVTKEEREMIENKMKSAGIKNMRAFIVRLVAEGRIIYVELDSVNEMTRLLSNATNNLNQIARKAHQTDNINKFDIEKIRRDYDILWEQVSEILRRLSSL